MIDFVRLPIPLGLGQAPVPESAGAPPVPTGAGSTPEHGKMMQCVAGGIALLGLIILPFVLD